MTEQVAKPSAALVHAPPKTKARGRRGRPQGSKNRNRRAVALSPSLRCIQEHIKRLLAQIGDAFKVVMKWTRLLCGSASMSHNDFGVRCNHCTIGDESNEARDKRT